MNEHNSTKRFSDRAGNYNEYRPGYPAAIIPFLEQTIGLKKNAVIADIGAGTGIFSSLFLEAGYAVKAIEPNAEMRLAAVANLGLSSRFTGVDGTAEHTGLRRHSVDLVIAAQAFHWFNQEEVSREFKRILRPGGYTLLVWNILQKDTDFLRGYAALKEKYAENLPHPIRANLDNIRRFFHPAPVITHTIRNTQLLDAEGLKGYLLSFSTVPLPGDKRYHEMIAALEDLSGRYAENGLLNMEYETMLYLSKND